MTYVNLTPHPIVLNSGEKYLPSGDIARVSSQHKLAEENKTYCPYCGSECSGYCIDCGCDVQLQLETPALFRLQYGEIEGLPEPVPGTYYIVSALVFSASDRKDLVAPATGHHDVVRNAQGQIASVPGFIVK